MSSTFTERDLAQRLNVRACKAVLLLRQFEETGTVARVDGGLWTLTAAGVAQARGLTQGAAHKWIERPLSWGIAA